jgi:putative acetyltransferase
MAEIVIRPERPADEEAVARLHREAFDGPGEAELVGRLRQGGLVAVSLIAEEDGEIVGHILLSWLKAEIGGEPLYALALAPMAVAPARQRRGIGSALVEASIDAAREIGADVILVLGHKYFYPRFGFSSQKGAIFDNPFNSDAFMALELGPGALCYAQGSVTYPPAFGLGDANELPRSAR